MKYVLSFTLFLLSALVILSSCKSEKPATIEEKPEAVQEEIGITTDMLTSSVCVVCGMDLAETGIKDTTVYEGQLYGFCSQECKQKFLEDPQKYLAETEEAEETAEPE